MYCTEHKERRFFCDSGCGLILCISSFEAGRRLALCSARQARRPPARFQISEEAKCLSVLSVCLSLSGCHSNSAIRKLHMLLPLSPAFFLCHSHIVGEKKKENRFMRTHTHKNRKHNEGRSRVHVRRPERTGFYVIVERLLSFHT